MTLSPNFCIVAGDFRCVKYQYSFSFFLFIFSILFQEKNQKGQQYKRKGQSNPIHFKDHDWDVSINFVHAGQKIIGA